MYSEGLCVVAPNKNGILHRVFVVAHKSQVTGILGPSGAGKTTLINAILGRISPELIEGGSISVRESNYNNVAYVMAKDCMWPYLTVAETLKTGADLRLPESLSVAKRQEAINKVIAHMKLQHCLNLLVGSDEEHHQNTISRGERRRVAIALELLSNPHILVLDEPTSGIDSVNAYEIVTLLNKLAHTAGLTILMTLHQPGDRIIALLDKVVLLMKGRLIYEGGIQDVVGYFESAGIVTNSNWSIADFMLDIASSKGCSVSLDDRAEFLANLFRNSPLFVATTSGVQLIRSEERDTTTSVPYLIDTPTVEESLVFMFKSQVSWQKQFCISLFRNWKRRSRTWRSTLFLWAAACIQALLFGSIFFDIGATNVTSSPIGLWSIWSNPWVQYFDRGRLDGFGLDPLYDLIRDGVNKQTHTFLILDLLQNFPAAVTYTTEVTICYRTIMPAPMLPLLPAWTVDFGNVDPIAEGYPSLNQLATAVVAMAQIAHLVETHAWHFPSVEKNHDDLFATFLPTVVRIAPYLTPLMCCLGSPMPFVLVVTKFTKKCAELYPNMTIPTPPQNWLWSDDFSASPNIAAFVAAERWMAENSGILHDPTTQIRRLLKFSIPKKRELVSSSADKNINSQSPKKFLGNFKIPTGRIAGLPIKQTQATPRRDSTGQVGFASTLVDFVQKLQDTEPRFKKIINNFKKLQDKLTTCQEKICENMAIRLNKAKTFFADSLATVGALVNVQGIVLFLLVNLGFLGFEVVSDLHRYRVPFNRERGLNLLGTSSHMLGAMVVDFPYHSVVAAIYTVVFMTMVNLPRYSFVNSIQFYGLIWLFSWASYSVAYFIGALTNRIDLGCVCLAGFTAFQLIVTGMFVSDASLPVWLAALRVISIYRFGYSALVITQFPVDENFGVMPNGVSRIIAGLQEWSLLNNVIMLSLLGVVYRIIAITLNDYLFKNVGIETC